MKTKEQKIKESIEILKELEKLLDERIVELHDIQGGMQARHAYIYYRHKVWGAIRALN